MAMLRSGLKKQVKAVFMIFLLLGQEGIKCHRLGLEGDSLENDEGPEAGEDAVDSSEQEVLDACTAADQADAKGTAEEDSELGELLSQSTRSDTLMQEQSEKDSREEPIESYLARLEDIEDTFPKLYRMITSAGDAAARASLMKTYLQQMSDFESLGEEAAKGDCVLGEDCAIKLPEGNLDGAKISLEAELPCTGQASALVPDQISPSIWSSPREGRTCAASLRDLTTTEHDLETCKEACDQESECGAVAFAPSTGACLLCQLISDGSTGAESLPKDVLSELHVRSRQWRLTIPTDGALEPGRSYICKTKAETSQVIGWVDIRNIRPGQHVACFENDASCTVDLTTFEALRGGELAIVKLEGPPMAKLEDANAEVRADVVDVFHDSKLEQQASALKKGTPVRVIQKVLVEPMMGSNDPEEQAALKAGSVAPGRSRLQLEFRMSSEKPLQQGWAEAGEDDGNFELHMLGDPSNTEEELEQKLWRVSAEEARNSRAAGCIGPNSKVISKTMLSSPVPGHLAATVDLSAMDGTGVYRMCYCREGFCEDGHTEGVGFLRVLPSCDAHAFQSFTEQLELAFNACADLDTCQEMRAKPSCLLQVDPLIFSPVRRFDVSKQELLGEPLKNCWSWARSHSQDALVQTWIQSNSQVWEFATQWETQCGPRVQRAQICGTHKEGSISRGLRQFLGADGENSADGLVTKTLATWGTGMWKVQRAVRDSLAAVWNLAEPDTYSGKSGKLACPPGMRISSITFASYGNPDHTCGQMKRGTCDAGPSVLAKVKHECMWKRKCQVRPFDEDGGRSIELPGEECEQALRTQLPILALEATCAQIEANVLEQIVDAKPKLAELIRELEPAVLEEVKQSRAQSERPAKVVQEVCAACKSSLRTISSTSTNLDAECEADSSSFECKLARMLNSTDFLDAYVKDVEMSFGKSIFGNARAAQQEVCADIHLCGFNSNRAVNLLLPAAGTGEGRADTIRHQLSLAFQDGYEDDRKSLDKQDDICDSCMHYQDPHVLLVDVWDSDYAYQASTKNNAEGIAELVKDDYLGGVYVDIGRMMVEGSLQGDFLLDGLPLEADEDRRVHMVKQITGHIFFSWKVDPTTKMLEVHVKGAEGIAAADSGMHGTSDPYVKVTVQGGRCMAEVRGCKMRSNKLGQSRARARSGIIQNNLSPRWDERFTFQLADEAELEANLLTDQAKIFALAIDAGSDAGQLLSVRRSFGSRAACVHVGMCEYSSKMAAMFGLGSRNYGIRQELVLKAEIDARYDTVMTQLNLYPCRSMIVPKNFLLMYQTWRNLHAISKTLFKMRHVVDDSYLVYVGNRNQQILRGLFHSDVMSSVPSYLRGLIEGAVQSMLTGKRISWTDFTVKMSIAFKRFVLSTAGKLLTAPLMLAITLIQLVFSGGKALFYDFFYKFVIQGVHEGKTKEQLWEEAKKWMETTGKAAYTSTKEAVFGSDKCKNTADGTPSFATGEDAKKLFAVNEEEAPAHGGSLLEVNASSANYAATGSHCNGQLNDQQFRIYEAASNGVSFSELQSRNDYVYMGTCWRTELRYQYGYSCSKCFCGSYYSASCKCSRPKSCCSCYHYRLVRVSYPCQKVGHYVGSSNYGNGWSFDRQWHESRVYANAQANPGAGACALHEMVQRDGAREAELKQKQHDENVRRALVILLYITIAIYVTVYLVCVGRSFPSSRMLRRQTGTAGMMVVRGALGCTLWPVTFKLMEKLAKEDEKFELWDVDYGR